MKKILFNDKFGLTQAVLEGRKTQTRKMLTMTLHRVDELKDEASETIEWIKERISEEGESNE